MRACKKSSSRQLPHSVPAAIANPTLIRWRIGTGTANRRWVNRHGPGQTMLQEAAREKMLPEERDVKCAQV